MTLLFGEVLSLKPGDVNNLYRDICTLYEFYVNHKETLTATFPSLIRMSLRLICETAAADLSTNLDKFIKGNFKRANATLDQDAKTTLSNNSVEEDKLIQLLHTGAHNYRSSSSLEQTLAMSLIIGAILNLTHRK